jgi:hypothetical protein
VEDCKWQDVNIRLLSEDLVKKEKRETPQASGKVVLTVTSHKRQNKNNDVYNCIEKTSQKVHLEKTHNKKWGDLQLALKLGF